MLVSPLGQHQLSDIIHSWKSFTSHKISQLRGKKGTFWQKESFDHIVRNPEQLEHIRQYIRDNPRVLPGSKRRDVVDTKNQRRDGTATVEAPSRRLENGGFDLILGNPPWLKVEWNSGAVLGDFEPRFVLKNTSAKEMADLREETFHRIPELEAAWRAEYEESEGAQNFLNAVGNYPELKGMQANLYKCFLPRAWANSSAKGVSGFVHPEGIYDDPNGGGFRREVYQRLRLHAQYQNEFALFVGTNDHGRMRFGLYVYVSKARDAVCFKSINNRHYHKPKKYFFPTFPSNTFCHFY